MTQSNCTGLQVQFIGVVSHFGGRRVLDQHNGTKVVLDSVVPDGIQRLSDRTSWLNFYDWGIVDYADRCTSLVLRRAHVPAISY
eukprot:1797675-Rhodomonas_salina.2